jgi:hypothetical protein
MTSREEALVAAGVRRAVLQWKAEQSLRRKLMEAGADPASLQREAEKLSEALRENRTIVR